MIARAVRRPRWERRHFVDELIDLTGTIALNCIFDGCVVRLHATSPVPHWIKDCLFVDCQLEGDGWRNTALQLVNRINKPMGE